MLNISIGATVQSIKAITRTDYVMANTTDYLRMYNNRHWFRDLATDAGIRIISIKLVYWFYPLVKRMLIKNSLMNTVAAPFYQNKVVSLFTYHIIL
ncbi:MAG: hypothetical protein ACOYVG_11195 [Bacteroidota bacterium]|jgi:hypothetical protein